MCKKWRYRVNAQKAIRVLTYANIAQFYTTIVGGVRLALGGFPARWLLGKRKLLVKKELAILCHRSRVKVIRVYHRRRFGMELPVFSSTTGKTSFAAKWRGMIDSDKVSRVAVARLSRAVK